VVIITVIPKTNNGIEAIKKHIKGTSIFDRVRMRTLGVSQELKGDSLYITMVNRATKTMETYMPEKLGEYFKDNISRLTQEINKFGVRENVDYIVEVK
jgi:hypothetical protein